MTPPERKPCAEHVFGDVTWLTRSFSEGSETKVPGVNFEGLPHGEFPENPGYLGHQVTPPGRQVPECGHRSGTAGLGKRAPAGRSDDIISRSREPCQMAAAAMTEADPLQPEPGCLPCARLQPRPT